MKQVEILTRQTADAYQWANKLITSVPQEKRDVIPEVLETSINWQVGHLILSNYFHSIMVIAGHQMDLVKTIPLKEYNELFSDGVPKNAKGKVDSEKLLQHLVIVQEKSIAIIKTLSDADLEQKLEPTPTPHPIAKIKLESLDWNIKHTMYHCGQIGMVKRVVDNRFDFGLRRAAQ